MSEHDLVKPESTGDPMHRPPRQSAQEKHNLDRLTKAMSTTQDAIHKVARTRAVWLKTHKGTGATVEDIMQSAQDHRTAELKMKEAIESEIEVHIDILEGN